MINPGCKKDTVSGKVSFAVSALSRRVKREGVTNVLSVH